jgi:hypothetical protein
VLNDIKDDSKSRQNFLRPGVLSKVLIALATPTVVFALLGGILGTVFLYLIIVVDGLALGWLALSRIDSGLNRIVTERNNDSVYNYSLVSGGRVLSIAIEVNLAAQRSSRFSTPARKNIAAFLSEIFSSASSTTSFSGILRPALESQAASDLRVLLSYKQEYEPLRKDANDDSPKISKGLPVLNGLTGRLGGRLDVDYLSRLERVVTALEEEEGSQMTIPAPKATQYSVGGSPSS